MESNSKFSILPFIILLSIFQYCNHPTTPSQNKDPRNYTWTIDTLTYPGSTFTMLSNIWGSSPNNMYVVGDCFDYRGRCWHYDGMKWTAFSPTNNSNYYYDDVYGFSERDIWIVGYLWSNDQPFDISSLILHFDGAAWKKFEIKGNYKIYSVGGSTANDVWFGGSNSLLFHWDGDTIKHAIIPVDYVPIDSAYKNQVVVNKIFSHSNGKNFFMIIDYHIQTAYLLANSMGGWNSLYNKTDAYLLNDFWVSKIGNVYKVDGSGFYKLSGSTWVNILGWYGAELIAIAATSDNNIFTVGNTNSGSNYSLAYYFNGKDYYLYENLKLKGIRFFDVWTNGNEAFIDGLAPYTQQTLILHGK